ncbi:Tim44 domain-containing protein [Acidisoma sp. C75]
MRRFLILAAALLPLLSLLAPQPADARAGGGHSMGSRGSRTFSAPRQTRIAPAIAPLERTQVPNTAIGRAPGAAGAGGFFNRRPFATGLLGGFLGAGLFGLFFGGGLFRFGMGFGSIIGLLLQILLILLVVRWLVRLFTGGGRGIGRPAMPGAPPPPRANAGGPASLRMPDAAASGGAGSAATGLGGFAHGPNPGGPRITPLQLTAADRQAFAQCLIYVQDAWGAGDLKAIAQVATPELTRYFAEQAANLARQGLRNRVSGVQIEAMELSEAWSEAGADFATVAMRFSLIDVTVDAANRVVDGSPDLRALVSEVWTFTRRPGSHWVLSAIQQVN